MNRITEKFNEKKGSGDKLMSLFITAGYPELNSTADLVLGFEKNGVEMVEIGMPFSDPMADGPTIQYSSEIALKNGVTIDKIFEMVRKIRKKSEMPLVLMGYINPILKYGVEEFCKNAAESGVDGLIVPDVPIEESEILEPSAKKHNLHIIYLVAPNTSAERLKITNKKASGFVYCVSVTGVTGARDDKEVSSSVDSFISRVRDNITDHPIMIGFGIKSYENAQHIALNADGFIVGSALIDTIRNSYPKQDWQKEVFSFVHSLKHGN